ncbi:ATP:ADP antiporter, AAA family [Nematocida displodere]|uniref:ADP,ATP carrier protein n=1 Tax=Nematocida displodere TaxID=1805483 RepID=A0A177EAU5_9MICR|nr:ATP:ADP antiporter, AAA family [Nematocida displodere]
MENQEVASNYKAKSLPTEDEHEALVDVECNPFFKVLKVEYPKFFCLAALGFSISFIYSTLRDGKDAIVMSRMVPASIPFLKTFVVLFFTVLFGIFFQVLMANGVPMRKIMIRANLGFAGYFLVYGLLVNFLSEHFEPGRFVVLDMFSDGKMAVNKLEGLKGLFLLYNFWTGSLFYLSSELWGSIILSLMFFGCVNEVCPLKQALRFYPLFMVSANIALVASGVLGHIVVAMSGGNPDTIYAFYRYFLVFISVLCVGNVFLYRHLMDKIIPFPIYILEGPKRSKSKTKVGVIKGITTAFSNSIILCLSISVLSYGMVTNLTEGAYNSTIANAAKSTGVSTLTTTLQTKATQQILIGLATIVFLLSPLKSFIQTRGWLSLGLLSPLFSLVGALIFFGCVWANVTSGAKGTTGLAKTVATKLGALLGGAPKTRTESEKHVGMIVTSLIKIMKYAAFDICKEAIGMKIPEAHRSRFKGVYDGVFGKFGKSAASGLQIILMAIFNTSDIRESVTVTATGVILVTLVWLYASYYLGAQYTKAVKEGRDLPVLVEEQVDPETAK